MHEAKVPTFRTNKQRRESRLVLTCHYLSDMRLTGAFNLWILLELAFYNLHGTNDTHTHGTKMMAVTLFYNPGAVTK